MSSAAARADLDVEVAVFDYRSWPDGLDDLVSRDELARAIDQQPENVERAPADGYRRENTLLIPPGQNTAAPVEAETLEQGNNGRGECIHTPRLPSICEHFSTI